MSKYANYRAASRAEWRPQSATASNEEITIGCLQRIANGVEKWGENIQRVESARDYYKREYNLARVEIKHLECRIVGLRGAITRMKKQRGAA